MVAAAVRIAMKLNLMIGFMHRFRTEALEAKRLLAGNAIGRIGSYLDAFCSLGGPHPPPWVWRKEIAGGGVLMYGGIHALDRLLWLLDAEVDEVTASMINYGGYGDVEDGLTALLKLSNGVTATLFENSPPYRTDAGWRTEIFGSNGAMRIKSGEMLEYSSALQAYTQQIRDEHHFQREIDEFVASISEGREPSIPGHAGYRALAVAQAIYTSAETRKSVRMQGFGQAL